MKLTSDSFSAFLKVMQIIGTGNEYLIVQNNKIRQLSNTKEMIFECDLSPLFESQTDNTLDLILKDIDQKHKMISIFYKQGSFISIRSIENGKEVFDDTSYITIPEPILKYAEKTNPVVTNSEYESRTLVNNNHLIVSDTIGDMVMERMNTYSKILTSEYLNVIFDIDKVTFRLSDGDLNSQTSASILTLDELEMDGIIGITKFRILPIINSPTPLKFSIYLDKNYKNACMCIDTTICNKPELTMKIWFMSPFEKLNDDNEMLII